MFDIKCIHLFENLVGPMKNIDRLKFGLQFKKGR
jgi:hypothetical protein